jgi:signal transduction histidine kinase
MENQPGLPRSPLLAWPNASLRTYLVVMILVATLPIAGLMTYQIFAKVEGERERMHDSMVRNVKVLAQTVDRELASTIDALHILSYSGTLQRGEIARFEQLLRTRPLLRPSWRGIYLVSPAGDVIFDTGPAGAGAHVRDRDAGEKARRPFAPQTYVSNVLGGADGSNFFTTVEVPVIVDGVARYVLGARIPMSVWQDVVETSGVSANGIAVIFDDDHRVIARNVTPARFIGTRLPAASLAVIDGRPSGSGRLARFEGGYSYATWDSVPLSGWGVSVGLPGEPLDAAHNQAIAAALATAAACLLLGIVLALVVARKMVRPLTLLSHNELAKATEPICVREIASLRDALLAAQAQDRAVQERLKYKRDLLQKQASEIETLLTSSPIGLAFAHDAQCREVTHNPAMDRLFGSAESLAAGDVCVLDQGRRLPREEQPLQRAAAQGETTRDRELELLVDGRPPAFVIVNAVPLFDSDGKPRGAIGAVVDITERKAAEARIVNTEQRLRESQHLVDLAQDVGHVGFFHYQFEADVFAWTPGLAKLFGRPDAQYQEQGTGPLADWTRCIDRSDWWRVLRQLRVAFRKQQETETVEYCVHHPDGSECWLSSRVQILYVRDGWPRQMIGITLDMSEQRKAEREREALIEREQAARVEAEAANHSKDIFLAMLGHELRNPLSAITAAIDVLDRFGAHSESEVNARRILSRQTHHLARLMDDLLDVARVVAGQVQLTRHSVDLAARVQRVTEALEITRRSSQQELTLDLNEVWIDADATRIEQIVNNLIVNAMKYTPAGGQIKVRVAADDGDALLEVSNSGAGIAPELLPRVFDLFTQGERGFDRRDGGLGIGLSLVRRLVELHGGRITAESGDQETVMRVRLPAIAAPAAERTPRRLPASGQRRVAIIEDNADVLEGLRTLLEVDGHTVWTATDGISGLALLVKVRPDVAIVDIGLPGLNGFEVARRSRAAGYAGRMIALSGYGQDADRKQGLAAGFDFYVLKPLDAQKLRELLESE